MKFSHKDNISHIARYKKKFIKQKKFSSISAVEDITNVEVVLSRFKHTVYLIFIRAKFLFFAVDEQINSQNAFAAYTLLKGYWETVAMMGYVVIKAQEYIAEGDYRELFALSKKISMGGKKFPSDDVIFSKGAAKIDYIQPNLSNMMEKMDKNFNVKVRNLDSNADGFKAEYNQMVAEAGHPTFLGLGFSIRKLKDGSYIPDLNKSWSKFEEKSLMNLLALSSAYFFYYWDQFNKMNTT